MIPNSATTSNIKFLSRNHPTWKFPTNGIVALRDAKIPLNLALYMVESEQRTSVLIADVHVDGTLCRHALGLCHNTWRQIVLFTTETKYNITLIFYYYYLSITRSTS